MKPLEGCTIAFVAHAPVATSQAEILRQAGATVRVASPELDMWTALGDGAFDALVLLVSEGEPSPATILGALESDSRTSLIPVLALIEPRFASELVRMTLSKSIAFLASDAPGEALVRAVNSLTMGRRSRLDLEEQQRLHHEQQRAVLSRSEETRAELNNLAHDLRTFLGIAFGFACNLRDGVVGTLNVGQQDHVKRIIDATLDATKLLDRTRDSARVSRSLPAMSMRPESLRPGRAQRTLVDLAALAESVKTLFEQSAEAQSKTITCTTEPVMLWGDALKLKQVLVNMVVNAVKYSPPGGAIGITVRWGKPAETLGVSARKPAEIVVTNTGAEIPREMRSRIFERGFRLQQHAHLPGQGVGLAIVRDVVAQHSGTIRADAALGGGTAFIASLPTDMRVRERAQGVLLVPESDAASVLVDAIRSARPDELTAMMADRPRQFLDLAAACGAYVVVPRNKETLLAEALAEILTPFPPSSQRP